jgi:predicted dinucleotide-binding enzyme
MKIGIIGGGGVGQTLGTGLQALGHEVTIGIRNPTTEELSKPRAQGVPLVDWIVASGGEVATMAEAAQSADLIINATQGEASIAALTLAGADNLSGKVLIDVSNPLDFSRGFPPALSAEYSGHTSLGEAIQSAFPAARVVKAFNTHGAAIMTNPGSVKGDHDLFVAGNDPAAKATVSEIAAALGWRHVQDMGDIKGARAMETLVLVWLQIMSVTGSSLHNLHVARG